MVGVVSVAQGEGHGAEVVLEHLLRGWPPDACTLVVLAPPESRLQRVCAETGHRCLSLGRVDRVHTNLWSVRRAAADCRGLQLVHAWTARGFECAWWLGASLGIPVTATLHDHPLAPFHGHLRRRVMRVAANRMAAVAAVSQAVLDACRQAGWRVPMEVLHNGLVDCPLPGRLHLPVVRIGFLGMYTAWKGFTVVEQWIRETGDNNAVWHLYGDVSNAHRSAADRLAAEFPARVVLEGAQAPERIFAATDMLVHASTDFDPLPTVLIEAARAGIPALASRLGGAAEIVEHGKTGLLFDPGDPADGLAGLRTLLEDAELRRRLGAAARRRFDARFQVAAMVDAYASFWRRYAAR